MVGSTLYMLNHGLSTAGLFLVVGYLIKRRGSRDVYAFGGVQKVAPVAGRRCSCSPGCPTLVAAGPVQLRRRSSWCWPGRSAGYPAYAAVSTLAIVLAALYILLMYQRTMTGPVTAGRRAHDHRRPERAGAAGAWRPLVILILVLGFFPKPMLDIIEPAVQATMQHVGVTDPEPWVTAEGGSAEPDGDHRTAASSTGC